jgi:hypothetical protein
VNPKSAHGRQLNWFCGNQRIEMVIKPAALALMVEVDKTFFSVIVNYVFEK